MRAIASSIIWPSMAPTPLAFSARIARALSTASALGVSAALIAAILRGMDGGLGGEAERHRGGDLVLQADLIVQIEEWGVDRGYARQSTGRDEPAACEGERRPCRGRPEVGGHVGGAQHQAGKAWRRRRDRLDRGEPARALDQADQPRVLARRGHQAVEDLEMADRLRLGQHQIIRRDANSE